MIPLSHYLPKGEKRNCLWWIIKPPGVSEVFVCLIYRKLEDPQRAKTIQLTIKDKTDHKGRLTDD